MATEEQGGTQAATPGTTHTLTTTINGAGTYQLIVNVSNLASHDESVQLICESKVRSGEGAASQKWAVTVPFSGSSAQFGSEPVFLAANEALDFKLKQIGGTGRNFVWSVKKA